MIEIIKFIIIFVPTKFNFLTKEYSKVYNKSKLVIHRLVFKKLSLYP